MQYSRHSWITADHTFHDQLVSSGNRKYTHFIFCIELIGWEFKNYIYIGLIGPALQKPNKQLTKCRHSTANHSKFSFHLQWNRNVTTSLVEFHLQPGETSNFSFDQLISYQIIELPVKYKFAKLGTKWK